MSLQIITLQIIPIKEKKAKKKQGSVEKKLKPPRMIFVSNVAEGATDRLFALQ
jgi:hypothetical protein